MAINEWWAGVPGERYWMEITDRLDGCGQPVREPIHHHGDIEKRGEIAHRHLLDVGAFQTVEHAAEECRRASAFGVGHHVMVPWTSRSMADSCATDGL